MTTMERAYEEFYSIPRQERLNKIDEFMGEDEDFPGLTHLLAYILKHYERQKKKSRTPPSHMNPIYSNALSVFDDFVEEKAQAYLDLLAQEDISNNS